MILKFRSLLFVGILNLVFICFAIESKAQCHFSSGPLGELCTSAIYVCGSDLNGYVGKLPEKLSVIQPWSGLCGGSGNADNIVWFSFTPCSSNVTLEITPSDCTIRSGGYTGVQAGLFSACNKSASVACTDHTSGNGVVSTFTLSSNSFMPGVTGYLFIDGYSGSVCDFTIKIIEGIDTTVVLPPDASKFTDGHITGRNEVECNEENTPITFTITPPECQVNVSSSCGQNPINPLDSICYVWKVSPSIGRSFENADSVGKSINLLFDLPGKYTITAESFFHPFYGGSCANAACGNIVSWEVTVASPDTIVNTPIYICPGHTTTYCNTQIDKDTTIICQVDLCSYEVQQFIVGTSKLNLVGTQYICSGGSYVFQNVSYTVPGSYDVVDTNDCTLLHKFTISVIDVSVSIVSNITTLDCNNTEIKLVASGTTNGLDALRYIWKVGPGVPISTTNELIVNAPGKYTVEAIYSTQYYNQCIDKKEITITQNIKKPEIVAFVPKLRCKLKNDPPSILTITTNDLLSSSQWVSPLGNSSQGLNIIVDSLNVSTGLPYQFTAIGVNGCRLDTSFVIQSNFDRANVQLTGDDITCINPKSTLSITTDITIDSVRWSRILPNPAFFGSEQDKKSIVADIAGIYEAKVMATSSRCWSTGDKEILDKILFPTVDVGNDVKWHCNTTQLDIKPTASSGNEYQYIWNSVGGNISTPLTSKEITISQPGVYVLNVLNTTNGCERNDSLQVIKETNIPSELVFDAYDINCFGQKDGELEIVNVIGGFGPYTYFLNGSKLSKTMISNLDKGDYKLEVRDKYDCLHEVDFKIIEPPVLSIDVPLEIMVEYSESSNITFQSNFPDSEILEISWLNEKDEILGNSFNYAFIGEKSDIITLEVVTINGCVTRSKIKINVDNQVDLYFPNIFSPNGDNVNDRFVIYKNKIPARINRLGIFDRYGNKVYEQNDFQFNDNPLGWDGTFNNKPVAIGVYVYVVDYTDYLGVKHVVKKDLTLVR